MLLHTTFNNLLTIINYFSTGIENNALATLDPTIKVFIMTSAFLGPISIVSLVILLKRIEKNDPNRIRWR